MSRRLQKTVVLILAIVMIASLFTGCGNSGSSSDSTSTTDSNSSSIDTASYGAVKTLKVWQPDTWGWDKPGKENDWDSYENCVAITEKTGIKLEYEVPVGTQDELLGPMIASNSLPDSMVIMHYSENPFINQMVDAGMLWSFDDLLGQYAPEALARLKESSAYSLHTYSDGKLYKFVGFEANEEKVKAFNLYGIPPTDGGSVWWARKDILKAFGKDDITSLDDYTDYLRFVKKNYPDVQPLMLKGYSYYSWLMTTFGVPYSGASGSMRCNITEDGTLELVAKNQNWLEYTKWFNMLYREGVISASQFTEQDQQANERKYSGMVGSFVCHYYDTQDNVNKPLIESGNEDITYVDIGPIQKDGIDFKLPALRDKGCLAWVVSKNIKEPEVAAKWFASIMYDDEINRLATGGFEGKDYTINSDGTIKVSDEFIKGINTSIESFCTETGLIAKFIPWISGPNWVAFVENPMAGKDANPEAYEVSIKRQGEKFIDDLWAKGFVDLPNSINPTSDAGIAKAKCDETINDLFLKLVLAKTDDEFQSIYRQGLADLEKQGAALYEKALNEEYQRQLKLLK
jgi:putative aldouronate transport system substrate-binding protein